MNPGISTWQLRGFYQEFNNSEITLSNSWDVSLTPNAALGHPDTWNRPADIDKQVCQTKKRVKSTTLEKRSSKMAIRHRHNPKFKSFWSKQKSDRYA